MADSCCLVGTSIKNPVCCADNPRVNTRFVLPPINEKQIRNADPPKTGGKNYERVTRLSLGDQQRLTEIERA